MAIETPTFWQTSSKMFLMRWFFRLFDIVSADEVRAHMTSLLKVKFAYYILADEETEYFSQMIKEKNITTVLGSKQM